MSLTVEQVSAPSRIAEEGEGIGIDELRLASRNHAMPMELLREELTPPGLHYVLTHYDIPAVDPFTWSLAVDGEVQRPAVPEPGRSPVDAAPAPCGSPSSARATAASACHRARSASPGSTAPSARRSGRACRCGTSSSDAAPTDRAVDVVFTGHDHGFERGVEQDYARGLTLADATTEDVLVAYAMNGSPLPLQHGFPVRLVVPGWYGMAHVKWLRSITVIDHTFDGYQNLAYRLRQEADDEGVPVTRIEPRALLMPPGDPDFMSRDRVMRPGAVRLRGRAWSGWAPVERVEVSTDGGSTWSEAELTPHEHRWAWREFSLLWQAVPGEHLLRVRAHDASGRIQATEPAWSRGGFANTADQPIKVYVLDE